MHRTEEFENVFFPEGVLREAVGIMEERTGQKAQWRDAGITDGLVEWGFDSETEFFAEYGQSLTSLRIHADVFTDGPSDFVDVSGPLISIYIFHSYGRWSIQVTAKNRRDLLAPFAAFRNNLEKYTLPAPPPPPQPPLKIFIGHGRSQDWRNLKDALHEHHGYDVETFETQPRAGYTIPEVIESMAHGNALALLVVTAEDEQIDGSVRARENVVHEVGYFQGRLGNKRAILIMEDGVNEFSNIHGIVHLPYKNIREVEGQVLAIIKREFPHLANGAASARQH
ncbi:TIR domain-containing protein [Arthrobacter sp. ES3-54]|uniref:TIR domain-containing protein n=1 Tax=Arthrobacter sp. ES3-54 TaxID=1502991 RepID=UPI0024076237|nr:TIR domain-containing protein [Arthrobacter sp. ES3-54]MDF9749176.1 putative nucleotide-binding protein [Arthrobacter sp. ES3-54]